MIDPKNIFVIPGMIPYPPTDGGRLCTFGLIDYLRKHNNIHILLFAGDKKDKSNIEILKGLWPEVVIHYVEAPEPVALSKTKRIEHAIKDILRPIYNLLTSKKAKFGTDPYSEYEPFRTTPFFPHGALFIEKLGAVIATNKFDIIQTETTEFINLVNIFPTDVKKVFVQLEGRADILYDYGLSNNLEPGYVKYVAGNAAFIEYAFMNKYNVVLALNESDKLKIAQKVSPEVKIYTSPFGLLDADLKKPNIDSYVYENLVFIGGEGHYPNFDALNWFLTGVLPEFKNKPFKKIYVSGVWSEDTRNFYSGLTDCIVFIGFVDDLTPYFKNSISIVPIRIGGGGIRTKTLLSMAHGSPVISTSLAAVGITGKHEQELLIADKAVDFAMAINTLFNNTKLTHSMAKSAYRLVEENYNQSHVGAIRNKIYQEITNNASA